MPVFLRGRFEHKATHIAGQDNIAADALSRNTTSLFFSVFQLAPPALCPLELDISSLESSIHEYFSRGITNSTHSTYSSAQTQYLGFFISESTSALSRGWHACLPPSCLLRARTISVYLSAVCHLQVSAGHAAVCREAGCNM